MGKGEIGTSIFGSENLKTLVSGTLILTKLIEYAYSKCCLTRLKFTQLVRVKLQICSLNAINQITRRVASKNMLNYSTTLLQSVILFLICTLVD